MKQYSPRILFQHKPVEANAEHPVLSESSNEEVDVLGSTAKSCQWPLLQGDLAHPGQMSKGGNFIKQNLHLSLFWRVSDVE